MQNLSSLLRKISDSLNASEHLNDTIRAIIEERSKVQLPADAVFYRDGVLELTASAVEKNEIRLREEDIKKELKERTGQQPRRIVYR